MDAGAAVAVASGWVLVVVVGVLVVGCWCLGAVAGVWVLVLLLLLLVVGCWCSGAWLGAGG